MSFIKSLSKHPKELWILSLSELCERFAFWGVGLLMVLYLIDYYQFSRESATQTFGIFTGCSAFLPFVGGWIADRWNYQGPIVLGAVFNAIGCYLIATGMISLFYFALVLMAFGFGIFTPSLLTVLGYTYRKKALLREAGFSIYYASINVGTFLALFSLGTIAKVWNWHAAFFVAGTVQAIGLIPIFYYLKHHKEMYLELKATQKATRAEKKPLSSKERDRLWVIVIFCVISILFWAAYNQGWSSMAIFAHSYMDKEVFGISIPEGVFLSSESFFLILLAPLLASLYAYLQKKNSDPSPAGKTVLSLFATAACFSIMMIGSRQIPEGALTADVSWGYLIIAYFLMAVGEMLLAPIGLSMVSRLSPPRYTATLVGFWYLCIGIAFFNGGMLASFMNRIETLFNFFAIFVAMASIPALILWAFAKKLTRMSHVESLEDSVHIGV